MHPTACDNVPLRTHAAHEDSNGGRPGTWPVTCRSRPPDPG